MNRLLILLLLTLSFVSCGKLTRGEVLEILNSGDVIPVSYRNIIILDSKAGYWIGNTHQYNRGGNWSPTDNPADVAAVHNLTPPSLHEIKSNSNIVDQDGRSVYIINRRGCRGCNLCYQKFDDAELISYRIIKGELGSQENLRIATSLTPKGSDYILISTETELLRATESQLFIKVAEYKFTKVLSITQDENSASAEVEYIVDYSPFAEALHYSDTSPSTIIYQFTRGDEGWKIAENECE